MKKSTIATAVLGIILAASVSLAGNQNVRFTQHNLSNNNDPSNGLTKANRFFYSASVDEVCVFCHTPHNAKPAVPLWNKYLPNNPAGYYMMYTSSRTLTPTARAATAPGAASLLCLSCHDGKTALNVIHTTRYGINAATAPGGGAQYTGYNVVDAMTTGDYNFYALGDFSFAGSPKTAGNIGGTDANPYAGNVLNDDHPIGFSYTAAQLQSNNRLNDLATVATKSSSKIRFFPPNNSIECSSCHDPHVNYDNINNAAPNQGDPTLRPFLAMSNGGSALCLSCHNK